MNIVVSIKNFIRPKALFVLRLVSRIMYHCSGKKNNNTLLLNEYKNKYHGKRCFIVCTGPSLRIEDLEKLHANGEYSFACNKINRIFDKTQWRPNFYCIMDETYEHTFLRTMNDVDAGIHFYSIDSFFTTRRVKHKVAWLHTKRGPFFLDHPVFSEDCSKEIYDIATVTYSMLQLAYFMGFSSAIIIGCDNSYSAEITRDGKIIYHGTKNYFCDSEAPTIAMAKPVPVWELNAVYDCAAEFIKTHNYDIVNATRGGHLETFKRIQFDTLF